MHESLILILNQLVAVGAEMKRRNETNPSLNLKVQITDLCTIISEVTYKITTDLQSPSKPADDGYNIEQQERDAYLLKRGSDDVGYDSAKIPLIKAIRERTKMGLKEAKDLAEKWINEKVYYNYIHKKYMETA